MVDYTHADDYWRFHTAKADRMDIPRYLKMLEIFCDTGEVAGRGSVWAEDHPWLEFDDPLMQHLVKLMSSPEVKLRVMGSRLCAKIFFATTGRFVVDVVKHRKFSMQRQWTERRQIGDAAQRFPGERSDEPDFDKAWSNLLQEIGARHSDDGFDIAFHEHQFNDCHRHKHGAADNTSSAPDTSRRDRWEKMVDDWAKALDQQVVDEEKRYIESNKAQLGSRLNRLLDDAQHYASQSGASEEEAVQAWRQMDGHWTSTEFERQMKLVRLQDCYPQIKEAMAIMGRVPNHGGRDRLAITTGRGIKIDHSTGSDIEGVTVGRDFSSLLPMETAMYMDDELEDVFLYKYTRSQLQTFRYRSNIGKPQRRLSQHHATRCGPMIVCIDTSASMHGVPQRIIQSALSLIEDTAERTRRDCYLIDFSVSVRAIDLRLRMRQRQYESIGFKPAGETFARGELPFIGGGTDATRMMDMMFRLLNNEANYINADVMWISDFLIPRPANAYMQRMSDFRLTGTRFYAMEIVPDGSDESEWGKAFDRMWRVGYRLLRRY